MVVLLVEIRLDSAILHAIHSQLKHQTGAFNPHVQFEIQIVKLDAFRCRETSKQTLRHGIEISRQCADRGEALPVSSRSLVEFAADQIVFDNQRLARPEVAGVVERNRLIS